jgi:hypothetical protein
MCVPKTGRQQKQAPAGGRGWKYFQIQFAEVRPRRLSLGITRDKQPRTDFKYKYQYKNQLARASFFHFVLFAVLVFLLFAQVKLAHWPQVAHHPIKR